MSRVEKLKPFSGAEIAHNWSPDDLKLQIVLRLRLGDQDDANAESVRDNPRHLPTSAELCELAGGIYDARRKRDKLLDRELFGEPAWDMMLALYCLPSRGEKLGVTALSYAAHVPLATGHRVQAALASHGLIERSPDDSDARLQLVRLTDKGRSLMETYLASLYCADRPVHPHSGLDCP